MSILIKELEPTFKKACDQCGITPDAVRSKSKTKTIRRKRLCVWKNLRKTGWSYHEIAALSNRTHPTIVQALRKK